MATIQECIICSEEKKYMTVGNCGHPMNCLECTYKLRVITKNEKCGYCNSKLDQVIVFNQYKKIPTEVETERSHEFKGGIYFFDDETKFECLKLENKACFVGTCKQYFQTLPQLLEHLKKGHNRFLCSLCTENRTLLIKEQIVYRKEEMDRHLLYGDYDDENNLIFLHPHCEYCNRNFFNDDLFLDHLRKDHFNCNLCDVKTCKYTYYKNFQDLSYHYEMSHFLCKHPDCSNAAVFKTNFELETHFSKEHDKNKSKKGNVVFSETSDMFEEKKKNDTFGFDFTNSVN